MAMKQTLDEFQIELESLIRARYPLIYLQSFEENRVLQMISKVGNHLGLDVILWSRTKGFQKNGQSISPTSDPLQALAWVEENKEPSIYVFLDFHSYVKDPTILRKIRDLGQLFKTSKRNILFLSPVCKMPEDISKDVTVLDVPLPSRLEVKTLIQGAASYAPQQSLDKETQENLINASTGLTTDEIENALAKSLVSKGHFDTHLIQEEKRQIVRKSGLLEFINAHQQELPDVGGLNLLQAWLKQRRRGFGQDAKEAGLPLPKGVLMVGIPGCGKSLTAVTVARLWNIPLIRLDLGKVFSGLVGSSESNLRKVIQTAEAVSPCILWIDEIEKGLSGSSKGSQDGGTASRVFGTLLTWLQEKKSPVFVVATANDVSSLPPEFLRKGRFDEIFFIDLPTQTERYQILKNLELKYGWKIDDLHIKEVSTITEGFSGAELEQILVDARFKAFYEGRELQHQDLISSSQLVIPLSKMMKSQLKSLREWASGRARPASSPATDLVPATENRFAQRTQNMETPSL